MGHCEVELSNSSFCRHQQQRLHQRYQPRLKINKNKRVSTCATKRRMQQRLGGATLRAVQLLFNSGLAVASHRLRLVRPCEGSTALPNYELIDNCTNIWPRPVF